MGYEYLETRSFQTEQVETPLVGQPLACHQTPTERRTPSPNGPAFPTCVANPKKGSLPKRSKYRYRQKNHRSADGPLFTWGTGGRIPRERLRWRQSSVCVANLKEGHRMRPRKPPTKNKYLSIPKWNRDRFGNPVAKFGRILNKPKIIQRKKSQGPKPEEWD